MKIYHYTKAIKIQSIFNDGYLATERKRSLSATQSFTDFVWLTEKKTYPKTALPLLSQFPETSIMVHMQRKNVLVDLQKIGEFFGSFYRFSFDTTDSRFKKWHFCEERKASINRTFLTMSERIANKVGDDTRSFWIATRDVELEKFGLEVYEHGTWRPLLSNASMSLLSDEDKAVINSHCSYSNRKCSELGIQNFAIAA
jgi:hypothetical protein